MDNWKKNYQQIKIDELYLDLKNPRIDSGENLTEGDVIRELLDENVMELASDIVQNGYLPVSLFMVAEQDGKSVVIDGNRRLLALKIIDNPDILHGIANEKDEQIARGFKKKLKEDLTVASVIVYPDRKKAERDMAKLHLAGIAYQEWRLIRQFRYFQRRIDFDQLSISKLAELLAILSSRVKEGIKTFQLYKIAKDRLSDVVDEIGQDIFSDKLFKTDKFQKAVVKSEGERFLGYTFSDDEQQVKISNEGQFLQRLRLILIAIYTQDRENPLYSAQFTASDRLQFFRTIDPNFLSDNEFKKAEKDRKELKDKGQKDLFGPDNNDNGLITTTPVTTIQTVPTSGASSKSVKDPKGLFWPSKTPYKLNNSSLKKMYDELKNIDVYFFPNATHDLLRSFLECTLVEYLMSIGEYAKIKNNEKHNPKLSELLDNVINNNLVDDDHVVESLKLIRSNWKEPYSLQRMNFVNHSKNYSSSENDVRAAWGMLEDLFRIILVPKQ